MNLTTEDTENTERATPETDALILSKSGFGPTDWEWRLHSRRLERERDEAREEWGKSSMDAAQLLSEKTKIMAERDQLKEALLIMENLLKPGIELFPEIGEILKQGAK